MSNQEIRIPSDIAPEVLGMATFAMELAEYRPLPENLVDTLG